MKNNPPSFLHIFRLVLSILILSSMVGFAWYSTKNQYSLKVELEETKQQLASISTEQRIRFRDITDRINGVSDTNTTLYDQVQSEQNKSTAFQEQIGKISDTLGTIDTLIKTDPQLLQKYSKIYFLNEHYVPPQLAQISPEFLTEQNKNLQIHSSVAPSLEKLLQAQKMANLKIQVVSAYRSFGEQSSLKASYKFTYGAGTANKFSADQGYSEHQLGTTVDFTTPDLSNTFTGFDMSPEYTWLVNNAYQYGFILSYPKQNTYYAYEPWHWRFVGVDLATKLHRENKFFYDLDQREINKYLAVIFE